MIAMKTFLWLLLLSKGLLLVFSSVFIMWPHLKVYYFCFHGNFFALQCRAMQLTLLLVFCMCGGIWCVPLDTWLAVHSTRTRKPTLRKCHFTRKKHKGSWMFTKCLCEEHYSSFYHSQHITNSHMLADWFIVIYNTAIFSFQFLIFCLAFLSCCVSYDDEINVKLYINTAVTHSWM